jgi:hypothetical protein
MVLGLIGCIWEGGALMVEMATEDAVDLGAFSLVVLFLRQLSAVNAVLVAEATAAATAESAGQKKQEPPLLLALVRPRAFRFS